MSFLKARLRPTDPMQQTQKFYCKKIKGLNQVFPCIPNAYFVVNFFYRTNGHDGEGEEEQRPVEY